MSANENVNELSISHRFVHAEHTITWPSFQPLPGLHLMRWKLDQVITSSQDTVGHGLQFFCPVSGWHGFEKPPGGNSCHETNFTELNSFLPLFLLPYALVTIVHNLMMLCSCFWIFVYRHRFMVTRLFQNK